MASTTSIVAQIKGDASNFDKSMDSATARAKNFGRDLNSIEGSGFGSNFGRGLSNRFTEMHSKIGLIKEALQMVKLPVTLAAAEDDLADRLEAVMGSADAATERMGMWRKAASLPGIDFTTITEADSRLQAMGYSAEKSKELLLELGNVVAKGYDAEALGTVAAALGKMTDKGEVSVKSLVALGQEMPILAKVLREQFGFDTAKEIEALDLTTQELMDNLVEGLKRLPTQAKDGFDVMDNEAEKFQFFLAGIGNKLADLNLMGDTAGTSMRGLFDAFSGDNMVGAMDAFAKLKDVAGQAWKGMSMEGLKEKWEELKQTMDTMTGGDQVTRTQATESDADRQARQDAFKKRAEDNAKAKAEEEKQKKLEATAPDRERERAEHRIQQLRNVGLEKQAAAEERALKTEREKQRLIQMGFTAEEAAKMAQSKTDSEDPNKKRGHIKRLTPEENELLGQQRMSAQDRAKAARGEHAIGTLGVTQSFGRSTEMKPSGMDYFEEARQNRIRNQPPKRPAANAPGSKLESQVLAAGGTSADAKAMLNKLDQLILTVKAYGRDPSAPTRR